MLAETGVAVARLSGLGSTMNTANRGNGPAGLTAFTGCWIGRFVIGKETEAPPEYVPLATLAP